MTWSYTDPSASEKDRYRFYIGDTQANEPILQDEEIDFVINEYKSHNYRMYILCQAAADFFARKIRRKVGPIEEFTVERQEHFEAKAAYYKALTSTDAPSFKKATVTFRKGMFDNV